MLKLGDNLAYRLSFVSFLLNKATGRIFGAHGFSTHEWRVMSVLHTYAPMPAQAIAQWVSLDKAAISRAVQMLLKRGIVQRKLHSIDARTVEISITTRGSRLYAMAAQRTAALQAELLAGVPDAERDVLFDMLSQIEEKLRAKPESAT
jgi:DNA-binding MarR family transcriptional regulator